MGGARDLASKVIVRGYRLQSDISDNDKSLLSGRFLFVTGTGRTLKSKKNSPE